MRIIALLAMLGIALCGCEKNRRGEPGTAGYVAPDFRKVKIVFVRETKVYDSGWNGRAIEQPYTTIEDDRGRRYVIRGVHGKLGDGFEADVSLMHPVTP